MKFTLDIGKVFIVNIKKENSKRRDYSYIYSKISIEISKEILIKRNSFEEKEILEIIKEYYNEMKNRGFCQNEEIYYYLIANKVNHNQL